MDSNCFMHALIVRMESLLLKVDLCGEKVNYDLLVCVSSLGKNILVKFIADWNGTLSNRINKSVLWSSLNIFAMEGSFGLYVLSTSEHKTFCLWIQVCKLCLWNSRPNHKVILLKVVVLNFKVVIAQDLGGL